MAKEQKEPKLISAVLIYSLMLIFVPLAVQLVLSQYTLFTLHFFVVDYVIILLLAKYIGRSATLISLFLVFILQVSLSLSKAYHFTFDTYLQSLLDVVYLNPLTLIGEVLGMAILFAVLLLIPVLKFYPKNNIRREALKIMLIAAVMTNLGLQFMDNTYRFLFNAEFLTFKTSKALLKDKNVDIENLEIIDSATSKIDLAELEDKNLVVIVVESLGLYNDEKYSNLLFKDFEDESIFKNHNMEKGNVAFFGSTVPGEIRELCQVKLLSLNPPKELLEKCWPSKLENHSKFAFHNFHGLFFNRAKWYKHLGFDKIYFQRDFTERVEIEEMCGHRFGGICDDDVIDTLKYEINSSEKPFIAYWLTLLSHTQPSENYSGEVFEECRKLQTDKDDDFVHDEVCVQLSNARSTLTKIKDFIINDIPDDSYVVIVGDHQPQFVLLDFRRFYNRQKVPYLILSPKTQ